MSQFFRPWVSVLSRKETILFPLSLISDMTYHGCKRRPLYWYEDLFKHLICIKTWANQWFHPYGPQFDLSCEILSAPRITVCFVWELVALMWFTCALKIIVRCRKYLYNIVYPKPDPARATCAPTACWDSHFVKLSIESYDSCKFKKKKKKKSLIIWTPQWAFCRSWPHGSDSTALVGWIIASTS